MNLTKRLWSRLLLTSSRLWARKGLATWGGPEELGFVVEEAAQALRQLGWHSLRRALASIWRIRSRVVELFADFLEGVVGIHFDAEAHAGPWLPSG